MAVPSTLFKNLSDRRSSDSHKQKTLSRSVSISGIGLFTGESTHLVIHPADVDVGIVFNRTDFPGESLSACLQNVVSTPRCTILGNKHFTIHTVEHLLATLRGLGINNAYLELSGPEVPIMDGSGLPFVELIEDAGVIELEKDTFTHSFQTPFFWSKGDVHLIALPGKGFRVSYTLHFPESTLLRSQHYSLEVDPESYINEIAPCRTFCLYEEIAPFIENGLIKGGGLDNAVIIKGDKIINPDGVRFPDEMVRHKVLDLIGDLSLIPCLFEGHIIAIRSGHASNIAFANGLFNHIMMENA